MIECSNKLLFIPLLDIIITSGELCKHTEVFLYINRLLDGSQGQKALIKTLAFEGCLERVDSVVYRLRHSPRM